MPKRRKRRPARGRGAVKSLVPSMTTQQVYRANLRFYDYASTNVATPIFVRCFLNLFGVASAGTAVFTIIQAIRVRRIRVMSVNSNINVLCDANLQWISEYGPNIKTTAQGSNALPAVIDQAPPKESLAGEWMNVSSTNLTKTVCVIGYTSGGIVDLFFEWVMNDGLGVSCTPTTSATTGNLYTNYFDNSYSDGLSAGQCRLIPLDRVSIKFYG